MEMIKSQKTGTIPPRWRQCVVMWFQVYTLSLLLGWVLSIKSTSVVSAAHFFTSQVNDDKYNHYVNYNNTICNNNALCN